MYKKKPDDHVAVNRAAWNGFSDNYQSQHGSQLDTRSLVWGAWSVPESELKALGDIRGRRILELGCGGGQWSGFLAREGARPVGLDLSERQLHHARGFRSRLGVDVPLVQASGEQLPFSAESFDLVLSDHGATTFADPHRIVPEAARVLVPGGRFAFCIASPLHIMCWSEELGGLGTELKKDYFGLQGHEDDDTVIFQMPYGEWIRLFRKSGFDILDLVEIRPGPRATTTYGDFVQLDWSRRWPAENLWVLQKRAGA